ncbi:hypothetical protein C8T65DRAFT_749686 [Cerioporus squamosus]|nr:hypothetical protein C8T65DRAFT_749686 [Cerioporus squamosus]
MHQNDLCEHLLKNIPKALNDDEQRALAREELAAAMQPLLELVSEYTGMHAGKTDGPTPLFWNQVEGDNFVNNVILSFTRFLAHIEEYKECLAALDISTGAMMASNTRTATPASSAGQLSSLGLDLTTPVAGSSGLGQLKKVAKNTSRTARLWELSTLSEYDLQGLNMRTRNKALMRAIEAQALLNPAPKQAPLKPKPKPRPVPSEK